MELCRKYHVFTARYGGDEFVIITNYHIKESPETIVTSFKEILQSMCETHNTAYPLTVSIGYAVVTNSALSLETAISTADQALYVEKRKFHVVNK